MAVTGCRSKLDATFDAPPIADAPHTSSSSTPAASALPQPVPAPAVTHASWSPDVLEELLAPIALYPDALLGQILAASVSTQEVLDAGNWLLQNERSSGNALDAAANQAGFGTAMRALMQFPSVVDMLCQQIDWTRQLGAAFISDQRSVLEAVQRLRMQAAQAGNLKSTPQQAVDTRRRNGTVILELKPAARKVVYVPHYDPQTVYSPTAAITSTMSTDAAIATDPVAFGIGVALANALTDHDHYYPHWSAGAIYCGLRPFYPPAYVYRPVYGPAFRPAYHYVPPPGYRHAHDSIEVHVKRAVGVGNDTYFDRFANHQNLRTVTAGEHANTWPDQAWQGRAMHAGTPDALANVRMRHIDRGYGTSTRVAEFRTRTAASVTSSRITAPIRDSAHDQAFSGAERAAAGAFDRAASARGHASAGARPGRLAHASRH